VICDKKNLLCGSGSDIGEELHLHATERLTGEGDVEEDDWIW
jgi:hypothetical protein